MKTAQLILIAAFVAGCGTPPAKPANSSTANNANNVNSANSATNAVFNAVNAELGCTDPSPGCGNCGIPTCTDGVWSCAPDTRCMADDCVVDGESSLDGVRIVFEGGRCEWTLAEVARGVQMPFAVAIESPVTISPISQQNGCEDLGPSGIAPFLQVSGNGQSYCLCDVGLCAGLPQTVDLVPGSYVDMAEWDGVNWFGPSDTGNPPGEPFPPGDYLVEITARGVANDAEYLVHGWMEITLTN